MIDFSTQQLSWLIVGSLSIGGTGYLSLTNKVDSIDKQLAVAINSSDNTVKAMDKIEKQLIRIEDKLDGKNRTK